MDELRLLLPTDMKAFAERQAEASGFTTVTDYVTALLEAEQLRAARRDLEDKLLEGLDSPYDPQSDHFLDELEKDLISRFPEVAGHAPPRPS